MTRFINIAVVAALMLCMLMQTPLVFAEGQYEYDGKKSRDLQRHVSGTDMVVDLVFARPIGFAGLVIGTLAFVVALPLTVPTQQVAETREKLVVAPAKYTFVRPLGVKPSGHE